MFGRLSCPNHFQGIKNNQSLGKRAIDYLTISINTVDSRNILRSCFRKSWTKNHFDKLFSQIGPSRTAHWDQNDTRFVELLKACLCILNLHSTGNQPKYKVTVSFEQCAWLHKTAGFH